MKIFFVFSILAFGYVFALWKYGGMDKSVMKKWNGQYEYEKKALVLAKENRILSARLSDLQYKFSSLESKNKYLTAQISDGPTNSRTIASIPKMNPADLVNFEVYKWTPDKLLAIGEKELQEL